MKIGRGQLGLAVALLCVAALPVLALGVDVADAEDELRRLDEQITFVEKEYAWDVARAYSEPAPAYPRRPAGGEALYLAAKALYLRRDLPPQEHERRTLEALAAVPPPFHLAAAYLKGVLRIQAGDLPAAAEAFRECVERPPQATDAGEKAQQREQRELCQLALARTYSELGRYGEALDCYQKIPRDSPRFGEALYEVASTYARAKQYQLALHTAALVLELASGTPLAPEAALLQGHVYLRLGRYSDSVRAYSQVRGEYAPIRDEIDAVLALREDPARYLGQLAGRPEKAFDASTMLPPLAVKWASMQSEAAAALQAVAALDQAERDLDEEEEIAERIEVGLSRGDGLDAFPHLQEGYARAEAAENASLKLEASIVARERELLASGLDAVGKAELASLESTRAEFEERVRGLPGSPEEIEVRLKRFRARFAEADRATFHAGHLLESCRTTFSAIRLWVDQHGSEIRGSDPEYADFLYEMHSHHEVVAAYQEELRALEREILETEGAVRGASLTQGEAALRGHLRRILESEWRLLARGRDRLGAGLAQEADRLEGLRQRIAGVDSRAQAARRKLLSHAQAGADALRRWLAVERQAIGAERASLAGLRGEAKDVAGRVAQESLQKLRAQVHRLVLRADLGIADVAWKRKRESLERIQQLEARKAAGLSDSYEPAIRDAELLERRERQDAIVRFEEFLRRYPDDPDYTPDAMFRLAELYYEHSNDDFNQAVAAWRDEVKQAAAEGHEGPPEPSKSFAPSIRLYRELLASFPGYRFQHGIIYLLAYCLGEMGQGEESLRTYAQLIERYPQSPFVPEAWVRIGDAQFDDARPGSLRRAAEAFSKMYAHPEHPLYVHAIYKLGFTSYRMDDYERAVESFTRLLDHYVEESRRTGKKPGGEVWPEAVEYLAISLAEGRGGEPARARSWFTSIGGRPYEAEVYQRLGDALLDRTRFAQAVAAYKLAIATDPLAPEAPRVQAKIIQAWGQEQRLDEEAKERELLVATYAERSPWWRKNAGDPELAREVRSLSQSSLAQAAAFHHARAQAFKRQGKQDRALAEYRVAAKAYGLHLSLWPRSKRAYELAYQYADCLYNSLEFEKAARAYAAVRDDTSGDRYAAEAALSAVISWEREVKRLESAGQLSPRKVVLSKDRAPGEALKPEPLPPVLQELVRESDAFVEKLPGDPKVAAIAYKAGEIFYAYDDYDEARCRLEDVVVRWPESEVARYSANLIIESYLATKDWRSVEQAAARLEQLRVALSPQLASTLRRFKLGGRFNRAVQLQEQKRYDEAARLFVDLVAEDPRHEFADKALYNAASCYESARRFESALRLYERIHAEYPKSAFADEALFRVAYSAENTYDFESAVDRYRLLVEKYPASRQRRDALYNAARCLENLQRYDEAARAFVRYAQLYPGAEDAARAQFHAALIYERTRQWRREVQSLQELVRRFWRAKEDELFVQAHLKMALAHKALGEDRQAREEYGATVAEFARRGLGPETHPRAAAAAAEARFRLAEYDLERYDRIQLPASSNTRKLEKALAAKLTVARKVGPKYEAVKRYKRPDWTLAAFYRQAYLLERLAQTLYDAPVPPEFKRPGQEEYLAAYQDRLAQFAQPYEDKAVEVYERAIQAARALHVKNEWTKKVSESLARYRPREYPVLKDPKGRMLAEDLSPGPLADSPEGSKQRPQPRSVAQAPPASALQAEPAPAGAPATPGHESHAGDKK